MFSQTEHQKIIVQTQHENIDIEFVPFLFRFLIAPSVWLSDAPQKRDFYCYFIFEIIKMILTTKVRRYYL
jgi:hypothetical protein